MSKVLLYSLLSFVITLAAVFGVSYPIMNGVMDSPERALEKYAEYNNSIINNEEPEHYLPDIAIANAYQVADFISTTDDWSDIPRPGVLPVTSTTQDFAITEIINIRKVARYTGVTPKVNLQDRDIIFGSEYDPEVSRIMKKDFDRKIVSLRGDMKLVESPELEPTESQFMALAVNDGKGWRIAQVYSYTDSFAGID